MEFTEVVRRRRMVRAYTNQPVEPDAIERILDAAVATPSAGHSQGQRFVVVTGKEQRSLIADAAGEAGYVTSGFDPWISGAPVHIVVCTDKQAYVDRYGEPDKAGIELWDVPYWWVDAGASMMAILYAAVSEGLAAGFLGAHGFDNIHDVLGIPQTVLILGVVTIGHGAADRPSGSLERGRVPRDEIIHRERW